MAKFCFFISVVTLVTVAYGSLPRARKFVVPIRETRPFEFPDCVPRTCTLPTEDVDCYEVGCRCDDVTNICREKECSDMPCTEETVADDCPSNCGCDENLWSCYEIPPPGDDTNHVSESDDSHDSHDSHDSDSKDYIDGGYGNDYGNDIDSDGSYYYGEEE